MLTLYPSRISGNVRIPASKSQTIRACLIALAARGVSVIRHPLYSGDTGSCFTALESLGCKVTHDMAGGCAVIDSSRLTEESDIVLDLGNSGTTTYLMYGILGTLGLGRITVTGDEQLCRRPIGALVSAYRDLGLEGECRTGCPPVRLSGRLTGGRTSIECPTSQYLSSLLLALPLAERDSEIEVPLLYEKPYVRMTLDWLDAQKIDYWISADLQNVRIRGGQQWHTFDRGVPADWSSAAFFLAAAALTGCRLTLQGLDASDSQGDKRMAGILEDMGCFVEYGTDSLTIQGPEKLCGGCYDINDIPDCLPILSVLGAVTDSPLTLTNVANARIKETDRIAVMAENLSLLGLKVEQAEDGLTVHPGKLKEGVTVPCRGDHRIIMAFSILSLVTDGGLTIDDESASAVTFPSFYSLLDSIKEDKRK